MLSHDDTAQANCSCTNGRAASLTAVWAGGYGGRGADTTGRYGV